MEDVTPKTHRLEDFTDLQGHQFRSLSYTLNSKNEEKFIPRNFFEGKQPDKEYYFREGHELTHTVSRVGLSMWPKGFDATRKLFRYDSALFLHKYLWEDTMEGQDLRCRYAATPINLFKTPKRRKTQASEMTSVLGFSSKS
jgi:hypothetical protein